jgi:hypothetical protein
MAREFNGANEYLEDANTPPVGADPGAFTVAGWFKTDTLTGDQTILSFADTGNGLGYFILQFGGSSWSDHIAFEVTRPGGGNGNCQTSTAASVNTWHHACAVHGASKASRAVYLDGGGKGTNTSDLSSSTWALDVTGIGRNSDSTPSDYMDGSVAEVAIWNTTLSDAEVAALAAGLSPLLMRPGNLIFYSPLIRDKDIDIVGGVSLTAYNAPTVDDHPPIIYKPPAIYLPPASGAVGYTLSAAYGSFTLSGQAANVEFGRIFTLEQGSYTLTGQSVTLSVGVILAAAQGSFTLTGQSVGFLYSRVMVAAYGDFSLTGQAATLTYSGSDYALSAAQGSFTLTGQAAGFTADRTVSMAYGSFTLSGQTANLTYATSTYTVTLAYGTFTLSGQAADLYYWHVTPAERIYIVLEDDRTCVVLADDRTLVVPVET